MKGSTMLAAQLNAMKAKLAAVTAERDVLKRALVASAQESCSHQIGDMSVKAVINVCMKKARAELEKEGKL